MSADQLSLLPSPLIIAITFNDTATVSGAKVHVGTLIIDEHGDASIIDAAGRDGSAATAAVLRILEELRATSGGKSEGDRAMTAICHALVRRMALDPS